MRRNDSKIGIAFHLFSFKWKKCGICSDEFKLESYWSWEYEGQKGFVCTGCAMTLREVNVMVQKKLGLMKRPIVRPRI